MSSTRTPARGATAEICDIPPLLAPYLGQQRLMRAEREQPGAVDDADAFIEMRAYPGQARFPGRTRHAFAAHRQPQPAKDVESARHMIGIGDDDHPAPPPL